MEFLWGLKIPLKEAAESKGLSRCFSNFGAPRKLLNVSLGMCLIGKGNGAEHGQCTSGISNCGVTQPKEKERQKAMTLMLSLV